MSKHFLTNALLGAAVLLMSANLNLVDAGHGGGHGGFGGGHGGFGGFHGGFGGFGGRGFGYGGFYGRGFGYGGFGYGGLYGLGYGGLYGGYGYGYPGYYGGYGYGGYPSYYGGYGYGGYPSYMMMSPYSNGMPSYSYAAPSIVSNSSSAAPVVSYYYAPAAKPYTEVQPAALTASTADIRVVVPDPNATVLLNGQKTTSTGSERIYRTPELKPGVSYQYQVRVTWKQDDHQITQEKTITVTPGRTTDVVLTSRLANEIVPTASTAK